MLVVEVSDVIHTVKQSDDLVVLLAFAQFFRATVQVANVGHNVDYLFAVHPQNHAKDAMG